MFDGAVVIVHSLTVSEELLILYSHEARHVVTWVVNCKLMFVHLQAPAC